MYGCMPPHHPTLTLNLNITITITLALALALCRVSPVMASFKARTVRYMDAAASQAWLEHGTRVLTEHTVDSAGIDPSWGQVPLADERFNGLVLFTARHKVSEF